MSKHFKKNTTLAISGTDSILQLGIDQTKFIRDHSVFSNKQENQKIIDENCIDAIKDLEIKIDNSEDEFEGEINNINTKSKDPLKEIKKDGMTLKRNINNQTDHTRYEQPKNLMKNDHSEYLTRQRMIRKQENYSFSSIDVVKLTYSI